MTFEDIEDIILTEIKAKMTYVRQAETYAGQFEVEKDIPQLPIQFPAVFVVYKGSDYAWVDGPNHNETCEFSVLVAAKNLRGQEAMRKDTYGCYQMIQDVLTNLVNKTFSLPIEKLRPLRVSMIFISKVLAIYAVDFQTNFDTAYSG